MDPVLGTIAVVAVLLGLPALAVLALLWMRRQIRIDVASRGGRIRRIQFVAFGRRRHDRYTFEVSYVDAAGNWHIAYCMTFGLGVHWTEDRIIGQAPSAEDGLSDRMST